MRVQKKKKNRKEEGEMKKSISTPIRGVSAGVSGPGNASSTLERRGAVRGERGEQTWED